MYSKARYQSSSNNFWPESSSSQLSSNNSAFLKKKKEELLIKEFLSPVDESADFLDPYSDLNLFLAQQIKQEMGPGGFGKKWSMKLQEELLLKITPEFHKKFPQYRLGVSALRKIWEKIAYYSHQIQNQREAITQDGKLNIHFFIKENLKQYHLLQSPSDLHPYHYAHQLGVKLSECIAAIDCTRPKLEYLTKMVWSVQRHLLTGSAWKSRSPYDEYDKIDKLIVKTILEISAKEPQITQNELEHQVRESLLSLHELPSFASQDAMTCNIAALLAEKLYPSCSLHTSLISEQKNAISNFLRRQTSLCKTATPSPQLSELIRRTLALYTLASGLPKDLTQEEIKAAVRAMYPVVKADKPHLPQSVYAFISAEIVLMKNEEYCHSQEYVCDSIATAYQETKHLPKLKDKETDLLEIVIWKMLSEKENLLEKLPYRIGQKIEEEIANILIDNPHQSFNAIVHLTVKHFQKLKELALNKKWAEIERKIHTWTIQGDMLCRFIRLDPDAPILKMIKEKWKSAEKLSSTAFFNEVAQSYLKQFPELALYTPQLISRIGILYKYVWYTLEDAHQESSFERFIKWHYNQLHLQLSDSTSEQMIHLLEELTKKNLPLTPFDANRCRQLLSLS